MDLDYNISDSIIPEVIVQDTILLIRSLNDSKDDGDRSSNLVELGRTLTKLGYNIKIISCDKNEEDSPNTLKVAQWIPKDIFGYLKIPLAFTRLFMIASVILMHKKSMSPMLIIVEELTYIIPLLNIFGDIKFMYVEDILKNMPIVDQLDNYRRRNRRHQLYYLRYVHKVVVSSRTSKFILEHKELNLKKHPILLYPNIETPEFLEERFIPANHILNQLNHDSIIMLMFGDFIPESNFDFGIESFERLQRKYQNHSFLYQNMYLIICGTCNNRDELEYMNKLMKSRIKSRNLIFIRNMPFVLRKELLKLSRCVLFPSIVFNHDQIVLMQCLRMGKVVIATECDVTDEFIQHESNGYICDASVNEFVFYMTKVITEPYAHKAWEATIKSLFSDYYGENQYITAVKSIFDHLDISGEVSIVADDMLSHDLSIDDYFISESDNNSLVHDSEVDEPQEEEIPDQLLELIPSPQINDNAIGEDGDDQDDDIASVPDENEFRNAILGHMSTPMGNVPDTLQQGFHTPTEDDYDYDSDSDLRPSPPSSDEEYETENFYLFPPTTGDEERDGQRPLFPIVEEAAEGHRNSSSSNFFTDAEISQMGEEIEGIAILPRENIDEDLNTTEIILSRQIHYTDEVEEVMTITEMSSDSRDSIDEYSETSEDISPNKTYVVETDENSVEEGVDVIELIEAQDDDTLENTNEYHPSEDSSVNQSFAELDEEEIEEGVEMVEEERAEDNITDSEPNENYSANSVLHTGLNAAEVEEEFEMVTTEEHNDTPMYSAEDLEQPAPDFLVLPRTNSFSAFVDGESWNFRRTRSYSLPRYWSPLENRPED